MSKKRDLSNDPEFMALQELQDIDSKKLMEQAGLGDPPADPPVDPPVDPPATPPVDPPVIPPTDPPVTHPADPAVNQHDEFLREIFGDKFKTVDEAKQANIPGVLNEVNTLRQEKTDLETKLSEKPKTNFANDEVALYNEFVRETGITNYGVFSKINSADLANMEPMDALVTKYIFDHPEQSNKEPQIRKFYEKKFNVDPEQVDEEELAINKIGMESEGGSAKKELLEIKGKIKVPEPQADPNTPKELTPEEKTSLQSGWNNVGTSVSKSLAQLKVPIKDGKDPFMVYDIPEAEQKEIIDFVVGYATENRMELNEANVRIMSTMVYNQIMLNKLPEIVHSVVEKTQGMTKEQIEAIYENPSTARNKDIPSTPPVTPVTDEEKQREDIFDAEMNMYNK